MRLEIGRWRVAPDGAPRLARSPGTWLHRASACYSGRIAGAGVITMTLLVGGSPIAAQPVTVRHAGKTVVIQRTLDDPRDLWVVPEDLTRVNGFVLKPEGACLADICIPIRQDRDSDLLVTRSGQQWFNLCAFARKIKQTFTVDYNKQIWNFGPLPFKKS